MAKLYAESGYIDWDYIYKNSQVYTFVTGGRGTGKTFGLLKYVFDHNLKFVFLRRTQKQIKMIKNPALNPFNALIANLGDKYAATIKSVGEEVSGVFRDGEDEPCGLLLPLSTISSVRGFDASNIEVLIYDEFIPEQHEKNIANEGGAFLNAIETIARNRELDGKPPLKVFCLANSNKLANPVYMELKIVNTVYKMFERGQSMMSIPERCLTIIHLTGSPISAKKEATSLYKLAGDSDFSRMALENEFAGVDDSQVKTRNLKEYRPLVTVGELTVYRHKNQRTYYVTEHRQGEPVTYEANEADLLRFRRDWVGLRLAHFGKRVFFENYMMVVLFEKYLNFK